jgi:hypothetical protein
VYPTTVAEKVEKSPQSCLQGLRIEDRNGPIMLGVVKMEEKKKQRPPPPKSRAVHPMILAEEVERRCQTCVALPPHSLSLCNPVRLWTIGVRCRHRPSANNVKGEEKPFSPHPRPGH